MRLICQDNVIRYTNSRIELAPITCAEANLVCQLRNNNREAFYNECLLLPQMHVDFLTYNKHESDLVYQVRFNKFITRSAVSMMVGKTRQQLGFTDHDIIGMTSLDMSDSHKGPIKIDQDSLPAGKYSGEYGRTVLLDDYRGLGLAEEVDRFIQGIAFDLFNLDYIFLTAYQDNVPIIKLHLKTGWRLTDTKFVYNDRVVDLMIYERSDWHAHGREDLERFLDGRNSLVAANGNRQ